MFILIACIKEDDVLTFLILGSILDYIFGPKKGKLFYPVFVFHKGMFNAQCYQWSGAISVEGGFNISWIYHGTMPFQYLKTVFAKQYSTLSLTGSQFILLKCYGSIWDLGGKFRQNVIRAKALILVKNNWEQAKNKVRLAVPKNIRTKCIEQDIRKNWDVYVILVQWFLTDCTKMSIKTVLWKIKKKRE